MRKIVCALALLACAGASHGQTKVGDWTVGTGDSGETYMVTENEAGVLFGQWCGSDADSCYFQVMSTTRCGPDFESPVILNADGGAQATTLACKGTATFRGKTLYRYRVTPYAQARKIIQRGPRLGIVIPVEGDNFRLLRFPLDGAAEALSRVDAGRQGRGGSRDSMGSRDSGSSRDSGRSRDAGDADDGTIRSGKRATRE